MKKLHRRHKKNRVLKSGAKVKAVAAMDLEEAHSANPEFKFSAKMANLTEQLNLQGDAVRPLKRFDICM